MKRITFIFIHLISIFLFTLQPVQAEEMNQASPIQGTADTTERIHLPIDLGQISPSYVFRYANYVANGVGLRNSGKGVIEISGIPSNASVRKAFLYWDILDDNIMTPSERPDVVYFQRINPNTSNTSNTVKFIGEVVGRGYDPCWYSVNFNFAFRADVTSEVTGNGRYKIKIGSGITTGEDPWDIMNLTPMVEGATLVVIYNIDLPPDPMIPVDSLNVYIYDRGLAGSMFWGELSYTLIGFWGKGERWTIIGADGQIGRSTSAMSPITTEMTSINGVAIAGPGSPYNDSNWNGSDGRPLPQLWDTHTHTLGPDVLPRRSDSAMVSFVSHGDCLVPVANILLIKSNIIVQPLPLENDLLQPSENEVLPVP